MTSTGRTSKRRALEWSKEVERRARDLYRLVWPETKRAKDVKREDTAGHPDLVGLPIHVQVKARHRTWVCREFLAAEKAAGGKLTHLVTQDSRGPLLVTMRLKDYINGLPLPEWMSKDACCGDEEELQDV